MKSKEKKTDPTFRFVAELPDLIDPETYRHESESNRMKFRISITGKGIEILGDSPCPARLEKLLAEMGAKTMEKVLCG